MTLVSNQTPNRNNIMLTESGPKLSNAVSLLTVTFNNLIGELEPQDAERHLWNYKQLEDAFESAAKIDDGHEMQAIAGMIADEVDHLLRKIWGIKTQK